MTIRRSGCTIVLACAVAWLAVYAGTIDPGSNPPGRVERVVRNALPAEIEVTKAALRATDETVRIQALERLRKLTPWSPEFRPLVLDCIKRGGAQESSLAIVVLMRIDGDRARILDLAALAAAHECAATLLCEIDSKYGAALASGFRLRNSMSLVHTKQMATILRSMADADVNQANDLLCRALQSVRGRPLQSFVELALRINPVPRRVGREIAELLHSADSARLEFTLKPLTSVPAKFVESSALAASLGLRYDAATGPVRIAILEALATQEVWGDGWARRLVGAAVGSDEHARQARTTLVSLAAVARSAANLLLMEARAGPAPRPELIPAIASIAPRSAPELVSGWLLSGDEPTRARILRALTAMEPHERLAGELANLARLRLVPPSRDLLRAAVRLDPEVSSEPVRALFIATLESGRDLEQLEAVRSLSRAEVIDNELLASLLELHTHQNAALRRGLLDCMHDGKVARVQDGVIRQRLLSLARRGIRKGGAKNASAWSRSVFLRLVLRTLKPDPVVRKLLADSLGSSDIQVRRVAIRGFLTVSNLSDREREAVLAASRERDAIIRQTADRILERQP